MGLFFADEISRSLLAEEISNIEKSLKEEESKKTKGPMKMENCMLNIQLHYRKQISVLLQKQIDDKKESCDYLEQQAANLKGASEFVSGSVNQTKSYSKACRYELAAIQDEIAVVERLLERNFTKLKHALQVGFGCSPVNTPRRNQVEESDSAFF